MALIICVFFLILLSHISVSENVSEEKLVLILLDGFRWDSVAKLGPANVPHFYEFINKGVHADYVQTIFPSISYPGWTTIATGLYPEQHGIMGNYIYNETSGDTFELATNDGDPVWWDQHVPIWTTATEAGINTSLYLWSRCDIPFKSILPKKCSPYNMQDAIDPILFEENLKSASQDLVDGYDFTLVYYGNVDELGHLDGPEAVSTFNEIIRVDRLLGQFMRDLDEKGLSPFTNIIIVSDHGMLDVTGRAYVELSKYTDVSNIKKVVDRGALSYVALENKETVDQVVEDLTAWSQVTVFKREDIPDHWHIRDNDFVLDLVIVTQYDGSDLIGSDFENPNDYVPVASDWSNNKGLHGWDDTSRDADGYVEGKASDMRAILYAKGPSFKSGYQHQWIKLVDEYQIFAHILNLTAEPHEGTWARVKEMFVAGETEDKDKVNWWNIVGYILSF